MKRNLVTGANGLLGAHVMLELLKRGQQVRALVRAGSERSDVLAFFKRFDGQGGQLATQIEWQEADITDLPVLEEAVAGLDQVFHCAGYVSFEKKDRAQLLRINEGGTANIVSACLQHQVRLCHVSSVAVLHNLDCKEALSETVFWKRSGRESDYAISKYNAEREVWRGIEEGLEAVIVNPSVILAAGFWTRSSSRMMDTVYKGNPFYTAGTTGYVAASDVAEVMVELMDRGISGERYILAEGNYTYRQMFSWMAEALGKPAPRWSISKAALRMAGIGERLLARLSGRPSRISPDIVNSAFNTQVYSSEKVRQTLNFKFMSIQELVKQAGRVYLEDRENAPPR
jgi:nucleoside-diphosphate-sugar epimerase